MFWKKNKPHKYMPLVGDNRPQIGDLFRYDEPNMLVKYVYIIDNMSPTLEGSGYEYIFSNSNCNIINDRAMSEPRHLDHLIIDGFLKKIDNDSLKAKLLLASKA